VLTLIGTVAVLFYLNWKLTLACGIFLPFSARALVLFRRRIANEARKIRERNAELGSVLLESIQGMKWIKTVGAEDTEASKLRNKNLEYIATLLRYQLVSAVAHGVPALFLALSTLALLLYGCHVVLAGGMSLGALVAFAAYQARVLGPVQSMVGLYLSVQRARVSLDRVFEFLDIEPEVVEAPNAHTPSQVAGAVEIRNLTFGYDPAQPVLNQLNLSIPAGARVAIVGPSGAGKSTLLDLLLRFYDPQQGSILLDGRDLRDLTLKTLRDNFGVITCEPFLFHASIRENIAYARAGATNEEVWAAARVADLEDFICSAPRGLDSVIGERGVKLSAGQRQRIAIARAVLHGARVWIFDEATATVDLLTESRIWDALADRIVGCTTLIVTHRLSSARSADQIVVLDQGEIVQTGTHDQLTTREGLYTLLHSAATAKLVVV
jgi:ABC-type multidrug transport system fused ATPase/permease subunit